MYNISDTDFFLEIRCSPYSRPYMTLTTMVKLHVPHVTVVKACYQYTVFENTIRHFSDMKQIRNTALKPVWSKCDLDILLNLIEIMLGKWSIHNA